MRCHFKLETIIRHLEYGGQSRIAHHVSLEVSVICQYLLQGTGSDDPTKSLSELDHYLEFRDDTVEQGMCSRNNKCCWLNSETPIEEVPCALLKTRLQCH